MTLLETERLIFRNWRKSDQEFFHFINSDDRVMEFFPFRRSRAEADRVLDNITAGIERDGFGFACAELKETGEPIGFVGLHKTENFEPHIPAGSIEIGWRLAPQFWRQGYANEGARAWLAFGFTGLGLDEIVSFTVWKNDASTAVMRRIGMRRDETSDFDYPLAPADQPYLRRVVVYRLTKSEWARA